jgi:Protein of unknown function (DUF3443)
LTRTGSHHTIVLPAALLAIAALCFSCGGASSGPSSSSSPPITTSGNNVQPITVNSGPSNNYANGVFTSITVCVPSSSTCQTINEVLVDTGSYGLRLLASAGNGALTLSLPALNGANGNPVAECAPFVSTYTWGPVMTADISISGERASNVPVQVIDPTFSSVPAACQNTGLQPNDTLATLGANGILGVGPFVQDCGDACAQSGAGNPGVYFACASDSCQVATLPLAQQVQNPVPLFASDNNGVILELPAVANPAPSLSGSLVFGIGTQSNNGLGSAQVFAINDNGNFSTTYNGQSYPAFIDSGSNAYYFLDSATTGLPTCGDNPGFYCPSSTTTVSATPFSGSASAAIRFSVSNADALFSNSTDAVFASLAGPNPGTFDWGLPFFFGRNVFTAIDGRSTPAGTGPYWAF